MTITEIRQQHKAAGSHWFEPGAIAFFKSRILPSVYEGAGGIFFVSSEKFSDDEARRYTVREFNPVTKDIKTRGEFNKLTKYRATTLAMELAYSKP